VTGSFVGVDIGGTKVALAALANGSLGDSVLRPTELSSSAALLNQVAELVDEVKQGDLAAVGVGVPSTVEFATGRVVSSVNIPLADVPLREVLGERLGVPVFVDNDATVAALAEAHDASLELVARNLVMLTIGTGVGSGIVLAGRIYRGSTGGAGELGHTIIGLGLQGQEHVPPPQRFPQPGSLEAVASGTALDRYAAEVAKLEPDSALAKLAAEEGRTTGEAAVVAAWEGDEVGVETIVRWAERIGIGIANAINTFDPDEVVIGGGGAKAGELLLENATRIARGYVHPGLVGNASIRLARHGVRAGVLGAALLALHECEHLPEKSATEVS
jgi:glucokinase